MIANINYENNKNMMAISLANTLLKENKKPVFLCVGTDKIIGDSVGAITGELLKTKYKLNGYIYGDLSNSINANNLENNIEKVKALHPNSPIVLIDSILGELDEVGQIKYYPNGAYAKGEFHKGVFVGDYSILAVVNTKGIDGLSFIKSVKLKTVIEQAEFIAESIYRAYKFSQNLI